MCSWRACLLVLTSVFASGCGGTSSVEATDPAASDLVVERTFVEGVAYAEGAISYVRVETADSETIAEETLPDANPAEVTLRLDPGRYRLRSWQRPCDGNCEQLDPPTDECDKAFTMRPNQRLRATVNIRPSLACEIVFR